MSIVVVGGCGYRASLCLTIVWVGSTSHAIVAREFEINIETFVARVVRFNRKNSIASFLYEKLEVATNNKFQSSMESHHQQSVFSKRKAFTLGARRFTKPN